MTVRVQAARVKSVDALRGMTVAAMLLVNDPGDWSHVYPQLEHAEWNGFTMTDLIFPLFLFLVGVSISLAAKLHAEGKQNSAGELNAIFARSARIVLLGLLLNLVGWLALDQSHFRPWGVLQRIGLCYAATAMLVLHVRPRAQWAIIAVLLVGYWMLLSWGGSYSQWSNLASRIDTALLGPLVYQFDTASGRGHDPEGLLSTLPAIATTLIGARAGQWLARGNVRALLLAGGIALLLGGAWSYWCPINKNLWTSSYVLWSAGWSLWLLAAFHVAIDVRGWPSIGRRFGVHAIAAYAGSELMVFALIVAGWWQTIYEKGFAQILAPSSGPYIASLAFAVAFVALWWLVVRAMDAFGLRLRI